MKNHVVFIGQVLQHGDTAAPYMEWVSPEHLLTASYCVPFRQSHLIAYVYKFMHAVI